MAQLHFGEGGGNPEGDRDVTARSSRALITCCYSTVPKSEQTLFYCLFFFIYLRGFLLRYFTQTLCLFLYLILWKIPKKPRDRNYPQG